MRRLAVLGFVLLLVASLFTGVKQVRPGERAVVRRFGRVLDTKPAPGLWIGLPWGMDRLDRVPVSLVRRLEVGYQPESADVTPTTADPSAADRPATPVGQLLTGDHNLVNVRVAVDYAVAPADEDLVDYILQQDRAEGLLARAVEAVLVEWAAGRRIDDILIQGKSELPPLLVARAQERIEPYRLGIRVYNAGVTHLLPPDEVKPAFDDVTRAQAAIRTRQEEALRTAVRRRAEARRDRNAREQQALAYQDEQRKSAQGEANAFEVRRAQYQRLRQDNPDALTALWWDEMTPVFAGMKEGGRIDLLDNHLGGDGLDISLVPPLPRKK